MKEQAEEDQGVVCCDSKIWIQSPRSAHRYYFEQGLSVRTPETCAEVGGDNSDREYTGANSADAAAPEKNNSVPRVRVSMSLLGSKPFYSADSATNLSCSRAKTGTNVAAVLVLYQKNNSFFLILDKLALDYLQSCLTDGNDEV